MAKSKIVLTFNSLPSIGDVLVYINDLNTYSLTEQFVNLRTSSSLSTIGTNLISCGYNYYQALNNDYNNGSNGSNYVLSYDYTLFKVTIEAVQDGVTFTESTNTTGGAITAVITNEPAIPILTIDDVSFSQSVSTNYCKIISVDVTTSLLATSISSPVIVGSNADNPFSFDYARGGNIDITCTDGVTVATKTVTLPDVLRASYISVDIFGNPNGVTATVNLTKSYGLTLSYQLEDSLGNLTAWQSSNVFTSVLNGTYTVHIKDTFGCEAQSDFAVSEFTPDITTNEAFNYLAKEMSIRFKKSVTWDNSSIYRVEENTLSCEEKVKIAYPYYHKFQTNDVINTQFLSNYENISANVIKEDGTKDILTISQRSQNIGATDKRDAWYYNALNGKTGIYYTSGETYDYTTGLANGIYDLSGALPNYGSVGSYIYLDALGWFQIEDIVYNEDYDADVLIIDNLYEGIPTEIIVSSVYNRKNYDVYEFAIDMSIYDGQEIQVEILQSDDTFGEYNYLSEKIQVVEEWQDTFEVKWYNPTDTFVYYSTGLINKARLYFEDFAASDDSSLQIHKTDLTTILISSDSYETVSLEITELSTGAKRQLTKAFLHKELYIDNIKYVSSSEPETENIKNTNQYILKATLNRTGQAFNSEYKGSENDIEGLEGIGLLQNNGTYIQIG